MRCIIAGGRDFFEFGFMCQKLNSIFKNSQPKQIISGGNREFNKDLGIWTGADYYGEVYALSFSIPLKIFPADWRQYNKAAGPIRNKQMAEYATHLIAFWDGKSKGTKDMITTAKELNLQTRIIFYNAD